MTEYVYIFGTALLTGAQYTRRTRHVVRRRNERGAIDTTTAVLLGLAIIAVTVIQVTGNDIPALLTQIVVAVLGGTVGAEVVTSIKDRRKKDDQ